MRLPDTLAGAQEHARQCRETLVRAENVWLQRVNAELADLRKAAQEAEDHVSNLLRIIPPNWKGYV